MNLVDLLPARARERPCQAAIIETRAGKDRVITFAGLERESALAAGLLRAHGIARGDRVLLLVPMSIDLYVALLGILRLGATAVLVDAGAGRRHVQLACEASRPSAVIGVASALWLRLFIPALRGIPLRFVVGPRCATGIPWSRAAGAPPADLVESCDGSAPALLTFTSGSTGQPKGSPRTHALLLAQHGVLRTSLRSEPGQADLCTLPVFALTNLGAGVTTVIPEGDLRRPGRIRAEPVFRQLRRLAPASIVASPALLERVLLSPCAGPEDVECLRRIFTGGAPAFPRFLDRLARAVPGAVITTLYGSTEAEPIAEQAYSDLSADDREASTRGRGLAAGRVVSGIRLAIIADRWGQPLGELDEDSFNAMRVPGNGVGEIVVAGEHVLRGYADPAHDSQTKFRVGTTTWHRTGDAGSIDREGRLWLAGRCGGRVDDQHGTMYPLQVESAADSILEGPRCAFVAVRGQRILAVEGASPLPPHTTRRLLSELAWAHIAGIRTVPRIPTDRRHNSKIEYPALLKLLRE